jgi:hypothetical protein
MTELRECRMDAGAYVMGEMDGSQEAAFRLHMNVCRSCRDQVEVLERAMAALPLMVPDTPPPAGPTRNALREARAEPREQARRALERSAGGTQSASGDGRPSVPRRRRAGSRPAKAGALALAVAAVLTIALSFATSTTTVYEAEITWTPGTAVVKVSDQHGALLATGMPAAPSGKVYEVWFEHGSAPVVPTSALFEVSSTGHVDVKLPGDLSGVSRVFVTPEPAGGSRVPTELPVLMATLR